MSNLQDELLKIIEDRSRVITGQIEEKYQSDNLGRKKGHAAALVFPITTQEVSGILQYAYNNQIVVTPRGAGTNLVGSTVPADGGIVLDFSQMNRILEVDTETFTATVEPGGVLADFQKYVEAQGLFYPPDPGEKLATIGGNISTNAGGMRAVKYGVTRDYVMGLEIVKADGTILMLGSKNRKDTSGLDLKEIIIGSEGTLAVITKCVLKLIPKPEESLSVVVSFDSLKRGIESVRTIIQANMNPTAIEFLERKVVKLGEDFLGLEFPDKDAGAYLLLTFDGTKEEIQHYLSRLTEVAKKSGAIGVTVLDNKELAENVWKIRGVLVKAVEAVSEQEPLDIVVPIHVIDTFVNFVNELEKKQNIQMISFGHAGDGNVHLCILRGERSEEVWEKDLDEVLTILYKKAYELGGLTSGEHGIGLSKKKYFYRETKKENVELMNAIKDVFDKKHILNDKISYVM